MPFNYLDATHGTSIQRQRFSNWCWAASTLFVCDCYDTHDNLNQPKLVARVLNIPACASEFPSPACNRTHDLGDAFERVDHLQNSINQPLSPTELINRFNNGEGPIGCQMILPETGGGHAVVMIDAIRNSVGRFFVKVGDPADGSILTIPYEVFRNNYRGHGGYWIRSYTTR